MVVVSVLPAAAHKVRIFASVDGTSIVGFVHFGSTARARQAAVSLLDAGGDEIARTRTNDRGEFRFAAARRTDHTVVVDLGDGHTARFTIPAADLPPTLAGGGIEPSTIASARAAVPAVGMVAEGTSPAALKALIDEAVARQVRPLREQLAAYEDKVRWHDVLGGLGYIAGVTGIACYVLGRRRLPAGGDADRRS
jgi:nickel transport protein